MSKIKQKRAKRRTEIIEAAVPLISSVPFDDISIAEICASIGISVGSFYHYFTKKSDLLIGLLLVIDEDLEKNVFPHLTNADELENLRAFAHGWACHVDAHGIERSKFISTINPESSDFIGQDRRSVQKLGEIISRGQEKGQISGEYDKDTLVQMFILMLRGLAADWSRRDGCYPIVEKMDEYIDFALRAFRP